MTNETPTTTVTIPTIVTAPPVATPVDTSGYTAIAIEVKTYFDKMYVAIRKGKTFRLGADEIHNLMLRISALGEEAKAEVEKEVAKIKTELKINKKVVDGNDNSGEKAKSEAVTTASSGQATPSVPPTK